MIVKACVDAGGSITGEHGVGVDKKRYMPPMFAEPDLATFQRLRCAFDPDGLANPGKVMPTPRLCGEVPGPYRQHPLEQAGRGGALLMATGGRARRRRASAEEAAALLRRCGAEGCAVRLRGGGTKLGWGPPAPDADVELSTAGLDQIARAQRGRPHRRARGRACRWPRRRSASPRRARCWRSTRPGAGGAATIGGVVATGDSGPLRHRYGGAARPGAWACAWRCPTAPSPSAGGKVIKNVAGYDLAKLFAGSFGTLGLILEVAVRLHPLPAGTATAVGAHRRPGPLAPRGLRAGARAARARLPRRALGRRRGAPCSPASAAPPRSRRPSGAGAAGAATASRPRWPTDDAELWERQRDAPALGETPRWCVCQASRRSSPARRRRARASAARWWAARPRPLVGPLRGAERGRGRSAASSRRRRASLLDAPREVRAALDAVGTERRRSSSMRRRQGSASTRRAASPRARSPAAC